MLQNELNFSGIPSINDFQSETWKELYTEMNQYQNKFLEKENEFRSKKYIWPSDALNNWSRVWEYPYIYYQLNKLRLEHNAGTKILDVGSGVTFFTTFLAEKGFDITATDIDPIAEKDLTKAIEVIKPQNGKANFKLCSEDSLPFGDNEFDFVTSLSVIEHVNNLNKNISEIYRVLKPGGFFILTFDIDLSGEYELQPEKYNYFKNLLLNNFDIFLNYKINHPSLYITNKNSIKPDPYYRKNINAKIKRIKNFIKKILGISYFHPGHLTFECVVLKKTNV